MERLYKIVRCATICGCLLLCVSSCGSSTSIYERERESKYEAAYEEGYNEGCEDGYREGFDYAYIAFESAINDEVVSYVREYSAWHPEEAVCIIEAYNSGKLVYEGVKITESVYKDAIESLLRYYEYFYCKEYEDYVW